MKKIIFVLIAFTIFLCCSYNSIEKNQQFIIGEWICDSIQAGYRTYKPENNAMLFYKNRVRVKTKYSSDGSMNITGQQKNNTKYIIKDSLLYVIQEGISDSIKKKIIQLDKIKMVLIENAIISNNVVYRGSIAHNEKIKLFYTKQ